MKYTEPFSICELNALLDCVPEEGALYWKTRSASDFSGKGAAKNAERWNKQFVGKPAITSITEAGYFRGAVKGKQVNAHRIVWAIAHGRWPKGLIDHINGDRQDNRISNLRETDHIGNGQNAKISKANKSGHTGISWCKQQEKWKVQLRDNRRKRTIGRFKELADAVAAKEQAYTEIGFHPNHGRK